ncbi:MAG: LacI family transcriptional regulator [Bacteroidaceae bacterium]|nr:LacI family transcriptional regulator [Bacteroidaceae bacterium]
MSVSPAITLKDIAQALGVSVTTVSRALKGNGRISAEMRERVLAYAREHNYTPNELAGSLRLSRQTPLHIIGVILPQIAHYYFSTILSGIEDEASKYGYRIMVAQSNESYEREVQICNTFLKNRVCGVIVSQAKDTVRYDHFLQLQQAGVPLVFYDRICTGLNTNRVVVDDYQGAFVAVSHLLDTGCRRIAFFGSTMRLQISKNRYNGYRDAILQHGLQIDNNLVFVCDNRKDAENLTPKLLTDENRPDAFFAVNDDTAIGILYTAKRLGFRVPDDISICGFTDGERAVACDPMLTTVGQRGDKVGREAVSILMDHVNQLVPNDKVVKRVVKTRLMLRGTSR